MKAQELYARLERDFIKPDMSDDWTSYMADINRFLTESFRRRSMGLVCDNTDTITRVYTAVFPEKSIMEKIIADEAHDALLFVHHPAIWDIRKIPVFSQMSPELHEEFRRKIGRAHV